MARFLTVVGAFFLLLAGWLFLGAISSTNPVESTGTAMSMGFSMIYLLIGALVLSLGLSRYKDHSDLFSTSGWYIFSFAILCLLVILKNKGNYDNYLWLLVWIILGLIYLCIGFFSNKNN